MSLVINTNISSLNTQNNLSKSQSALSQATQRLSSGLKINSAADNAAGFAISQRYTTQIGGLAQASSNASDAINLAQTAGSALDQVTSNLQAIRDLAAQAANGTYSASDRTTINQEVQQRLQEVTRIANQTTFNGQNVLDGSLKSQTFQIGANVGQTVSVGLGTDVKSSALGTNVAEISTGDLSDAFVGSNGSTTDAATTKAYGLDLSKLTITLPGATGSDATALQAGVAIGSTTANSVQDVSDAINANSELAKAGVTAAVNDNGGVSVFYTGAGSISLTDAGAASTTSKYADTVANGGDANTDILAAGTQNGTTTAVASGGAVTADSSQSLATGDVLTVDNANSLITRVDQALSTVSDFSAQLGAVQNRFQSTISTLSAQTTNLQSSQSTIQDADFAAETANLSKAQVLQQAGISVLAQANSNPQQVLKLLQ
jgi:flagellin